MPAQDLLKEVTKIGVKLDVIKEDLEKANHKLDETFDVIYKGSEDRPSIMSRLLQIELTLKQHKDNKQTMWLIFATAAGWIATLSVGLWDRKEQIAAWLKN
jgi:hypothetical protein